MRLLEWPVQQGLLAEQGAREARLLSVLRVEVLPVPVLAESAEPVVPLLREPAVREVREVPAVQGAEPLLPAVREVREVREVQGE